jgi:ADP-glucose pyrophosphorylase
VAADAVIRNSIVGDEAVVAAGASVIDSVLLPGARIGEGAVVERSLVMGRVGAGATAIDSMVGADGDVADGSVLTDASIPAVT